MARGCSSRCRSWRSVTTRAMRRCSWRKTSRLRSRADTAITLACRVATRDLTLTLALSRQRERGTQTLFTCQREWRLKAPFSRLGGRRVGMRVGKESNHRELGVLQRQNLGAALAKLHVHARVEAGAFEVDHHALAKLGVQY